LWFFCDKESRSVVKGEIPMMSKPCLKALLFARHIFIHSETRSVLWVGGEAWWNGTVFTTRSSVRFLSRERTMEKWN